MKLSGREAVRFCERNQEGITAVLIHGSDAGLVDECRRSLVTATMDGTVDEMRLTQLDAGDVRRDPSLLDEEARAQGFFPGRRVIVVAKATDGLGKAVAPVLDALTPADALVVFTADQLPARSTLRKSFEAGGTFASLQLFTDPPDLEEITQLLERFGAGAKLDTDARDAMLGLARDLDRGSFIRLIEILGLRALSSDHCVTLEDIESLSPLGRDAELDRFVSAVASGQAQALGPLLRRLTASGIAPVGILIALQRHFRMLLRIAAAGGGNSGLSAIRPPLWGPRRDEVVSQLRSWSTDRLEAASRLLFQVDGSVRSSGKAPDLAIVERCALRLSLMVRR